jgi:transposase
MAAHKLLPHYAQTRKTKNFATEPDLLKRDIVPVIPPKSNRKFPAEFDKETYKWRHLIENYFGKQKENKGIAMRSCKTDQSFKAFISIAATIIHTR